MGRSADIHIVEEISGASFIPISATPTHPLIFPNKLQHILLRKAKQFILRIVFTALKLH